MTRLELLLLITEFGLSCYLAARILGLRYAHAKRIYRVFTRERRVRSHFRSPTKVIDLRAERTQNICQTLRQICLCKLKAALDSTLLKDWQKEKIRDSNFDELIGQPCLAQANASFLGDQFSQSK